MKPTTKLKTLLSKTGITSQEAMRFALVPEIGESAPRFPAVWRRMGPDFVAYAIATGMGRLDQFGSIDGVEVSNIVWSEESFEDAKCKVLHVTASGVETFTFLPQ